MNIYEHFATALETAQEISAVLRSANEERCTGLYNAVVETLGKTDGLNNAEVLVVLLMVVTTIIRSHPADKQQRLTQDVIPGLLDHHLNFFVEDKQP